MSARRLIEDVRAAGAVLEVEKGDLIVDADDDFPEQLLGELRRQKPEVIEALTSGESGLDEERAAITEYDGNAPRAWAEGFARLDPDRPPGDVPAPRWQQFVDDVGRFIDGPFCRIAVALGWRPHDLFGCNRDRPFARIDQAGLLWLLNGNEVVALTETTASIRTRSGDRHIYRRRPATRGQVIAWELDKQIPAARVSSDEPPF